MKLKNLIWCEIVVKMKRFKWVWEDIEFKNKKNKVHLWYKWLDLRVVGSNFGYKEK